MRNPTFADEFHLSPRPERCIGMNQRADSSFDPSGPTLSMGIKTITHSRTGLKIVPHEVVVIELVDGNEVGSFDLSPSLARAYAKRLGEFADAIESKKAS